VYAKCIDGEEAVARQRVAIALGLTEDGTIG
jgi:hypothetical protein